MSQQNKYNAEQTPERIKLPNTINESTINQVHHPIQQPQLSWRHQSRRGEGGKSPETPRSVRQNEDWLQASILSSQNGFTHQSMLFLKKIKKFLCKRVNTEQYNHDQLGIKLHDYAKVRHSLEYYAEWGRAVLVVHSYQAYVHRHWHYGHSGH